MVVVVVRLVVEVVEEEAVLSVDCVESAVLSVIEAEVEGAAVLLVALVLVDE